MPRTPSVLTVFTTPLGVSSAVVSLAAAAWLVVGSRIASPPLLNALEAAAWPVASTQHSNHRQEVGRATGTMAEPLLFATSVGPGATSEVSMTLRGIAKGPRDQAALIAIGDGRAEWMALGQSREGITLVDIQSSKVVIDTALGFRTLDLNKQTAAPSASASLDRKP